MLTSITYFFPGSAIIFLRKTAESSYGLYAGMEFYKIAAVAKNRLASTFLSSSCLRWVTTKINAHTHKNSQRRLVNLQQASMGGRHHQKYKDVK